MAEKARIQEIDFSEVLQIDPYLWKESKWEDANEKVVGSYNRGEKGICAKEGKCISVVKKGERRGTWVHRRTIEKRVYQTFKVVSNGTSFFCMKEGQ